MSPELVPVPESPDPFDAVDPVIDELHQRLRSLDTHCLAALESGLHGMLDGDFTLAADPVTEPIVSDSADAHVRALVDLFNAMLLRTQAALSAYESLRVELARALGDRSCLPELTERLHSLETHCLTALDTGLQAIVDGDHTVHAEPVTAPLRPASDSRLGELGETFNRMLARSRTAVRSYDTLREELEQTLGSRSSLEELRAGLRSLDRHCLRDLDEGLEALASGTTLTRRATPVTVPIVAGETERDIGELATTFNRMLSRAQSALVHYDRLAGPGTL